MGKSDPAQTGDVSASGKLTAVLGLVSAGEQERILYSSTDGIDGRSPIVVSGAIFEPKGTPPKDGWPVIAWAHGTLGVADICAPSWAVRSYRDIAYLDTWLAQGYAVVATDYQGLGTPGGHPYFVARSEAYSVLDSVRAALVHDSKLRNSVVTVGQSQGGGVASVRRASHRPMPPMSTCSARSHFYVRGRKAGRTLLDLDYPPGGTGSVSVIVTL